MSRRTTLKASGVRDDVDEQTSCTNLTVMDDSLFIGNISYEILAILMTSIACASLILTYA